jgi:hypothetical protein
VQATLACHPEVELDAAADCTDRIIETVPPPVLRIALVIQQTTTRFCGASRNSLAGWQLSALRGTAVPAPGTVHLVPGTLTPAAETALRAPEISAPPTGRPPDMILQQPAGTTDVSETGRKTVPSRAPTASRETNTVDVSGGERLHHRHRPPLYHRQVH